MIKKKANAFLFSSSVKLFYSAKDKKTPNLTYLDWVEVSFQERKILYLTRKFHLKNPRLALFIRHKRATFTYLST